MNPTPDQQAAVERLYENEAIIDNLTSDVAQPLLQWAEQQILGGAAPDAVVSAVSAANQSGAQDAGAALAEAQRTLDAAAASHSSAGETALEEPATPGALAAPMASAEPARPAAPQPPAEGAPQQPLRRRRRRHSTTPAKRKRA